jgi:hypothetical protein
MNFIAFSEFALNGQQEFRQYGITMPFYEDI